MSYNEDLSHINHSIKEFEDHPMLESSIIESKGIQIESRSLERCPECGYSNIIMDRNIGEVVCSQCGLVIKDVILDQKPEWRAFTLDEKRSKSRVGSPESLSYYDKGLTTTFKTGKDAFGRKLPWKKRVEMERLKFWNTRSKVQSSSQRNLSQAMTELDRLNDKLNIPKSIREDAAFLYRRALKKGLVRGRSIAAIAAASLYAACRMTSTPRRLQDIVKASTRTRKEIARCYRLLQRELDMKIPVNDPSNYVPKIASKLKLSQNLQNKAMEIIRMANREKHNSGKDPTGIAAASLYIASIIEREKVTQKDLAEAAGVTEVTVRNRYRGIVNSLNIEELLKNDSSENNASLNKLKTYSS
jgi:transcription initiation factor TFIIB